MKRIVSLACVLAMAGLLCACVSSPLASGKAGASLPENVSSGIPDVIVVSGSNYEMGFQYGTQCAAKIKYATGIAKQSAMPYFGVETVLKDLEVISYYADRFNPKMREWIEGMQAGCKAAGYSVSYYDLLLNIVLPSELWCRPTEPYPAETGVKGDAVASASSARFADHACTAFAVTGSATPDGKTLIGISGGGVMEIVDRVILIAFPEEGQSYVTLTTPGRPVDQVALNGAGLAYVMTASFSDPTPWGVMPEIVWHYIVQYCGSIEEAGAYLEKTVPRSGAIGNFVMGDSTGEIAVFETNAECFFKRTPGVQGETAPFMVQTNHFASPETEKYNIGGMEEWNYDSFTRFATCWEYVEAAAAKGGVDIAFIRNMFHSDDWYDPAEGVWHSNDPGPGLGFNKIDYTQNTVFAPLDLTAYFILGSGSGVGVPAEATGEFAKVQLGENPMGIADSMKWESFGLFNAARNLLRSEMNVNAGLVREKRYLTDTAAQSIEAMLDEAWLEYERGMDRSAWAFEAELSGKPAAEQLALWGEAMSHYVRTQLLAQVVTARLEAISAR